MLTDKEKIIKYESLLHMLQLNAEVAMNSKNVGKLIDNICHWSYAHRVGNGMFSYDEQNDIIEKAFHKLIDL